MLCAIALAASLASLGLSLYALLRRPRPVAAEDPFAEPTSPEKAAELREKLGHLGEQLASQSPGGFVRPSFQRGMHASR